MLNLHLLTQVDHFDMLISKVARKRKRCGHPWVPAVAGVQAQPCFPPSITPVSELTAQAAGVEVTPSAWITAECVCC